MQGVADLRRNRWARRRVGAGWQRGRFSPGSGRLELGIGPLFGLGGGNATDVEGTSIDFSGVGLAGVTSTIGSRYHPPDGGLIFRGGLVPFYSGGPQLWAGLSLGYAF